MARKDLNSYIGNIGLYQWQVFVVVAILTIFVVDSIHIIFIGADMAHWCRVPELENLPYDVQKNVAIPTETQGDGSIEYSSCEMFSLNYSVYSRSEFDSWNRSLMISIDTTVERCKHWAYDQSQFKSTIVKKFNLVCGREFLVQMTSTVFMAGYLVGAFSSGAVSDRFGRKTTMLVYFGIKIIGTLMSIFGPYYAVFAVGRFLMGMGGPGYALTGYVLVMELIGERYRPVLGTLLQIAFSVGYMLQPAFAVGLRDEFWYQIAATAAHATFPFLIIFLIPESPRWLTVHGKYEEVTKLLKKICRVNGKQLPDDFKPTSLIDEHEVVEGKSCLALLTSPTMRLWTLVMDFSWFTCSLIYYAHALNTGTLHGDIYLNTFISGAVEIPAYILCIFMMDWRWLGRRWTSLAGSIGAAIASFVCIPMILYSFHTATTALSIVGKALISITFSSIYVYSNELFPTEVRNVGVGSASMCARISSMAASYVGGPLGSVWQPLPSLVFGVFATVSGLLFIFLPETLGQVLPDTIEQAEQLGKRSGKKYSHAVEQEGETNIAADTSDDLPSSWVQTPSKLTLNDIAKTEQLSTITKF